MKIIYHFSTQAKNDIDPSSNSVNNSSLGNDWKLCDVTKAISRMRSETDFVSRGQLSHEKYSLELCVFPFSPFVQQGSSEKRCRSKGVIDIIILYSAPFQNLPRLSAIDSFILEETYSVAKA